MKTIKKSLALFLCLVMMMAIAPLSVFAEDVVVADAAITAADITGLDVTPVAGELKPTVADLVQVGEGYTTALKWSTEYDGIDNTFFVDGKDYSVEIILTAKEGYVFTDATKLTVDANDITDYTLYEEGKVLSCKIDVGSTPEDPDKKDPLQSFWQMIVDFFESIANMLGSLFGFDK